MRLARALWRLLTPWGGKGSRGVLVSAAKPGRQPTPPQGPPRVRSLYDGPDGLRRLKDKVAESNNPQSADFYLDKILDHPDYQSADTP